MDKDQHWWRPYIGRGTNNCVLVSNIVKICVTLTFNAFNFITEDKIGIFTVDLLLIILI